MMLKMNTKIMIIKKIKNVAIGIIVAGVMIAMMMKVAVIKNFIFSLYLVDIFFSHFKIVVIFKKINFIDYVK